MKLNILSFKLIFLVSSFLFMNALCVNYSFLEESYDSYLEKNNLNDYVDSIVSKINNKKMSCYLSKKKFLKLSEEDKLNEKIPIKTTNITALNSQINKFNSVFKSISKNVFFLCDLMKKLKELSANSINPTLILESSETHCKKEEALFISIIAKLTFERKIYQPIGVSYDLENLQGNWKSYLVLMGKEGLENKLYKICFNPYHIDVIILLESYENSCFNIIENMEKSNIFANEDPLYSEQNFKSKKFEELNVQKDINPQLAPKQTSFLENSITNELKSESILNNSNESSTSNVSISKIMNKFTFDELSKIKSVIKFAKKNNILEKIYTSQGEFEFNSSNHNNSTNIIEVFNEIKNEEAKINNIENILNEMKNNLSSIKINLMKSNLINNSAKSKLVIENEESSRNNDINRLIEHSKIKDLDEEILFETSANSGNNDIKSNKSEKLSSLNKNAFSSKKQENTFRKHSLNQRKVPQANLKSPANNNIKGSTGIKSYAEKYKIELGNKMKYNNNPDDDDLDMFNSP